MTLELTDPHPIERAEEILTPEALAFVEQLHLRFAGRRDELLSARAARRSAAASARRLDFLPETRAGARVRVAGRLRRRPRCRTDGWR